MQLGILILLLIATIFGSSFWYIQIDTACDIPVRYRIGEIDARFGTSEEEVRRIAGNAELIWEDALLADLFVYDPDAEFAINFVFDARQENAEIEEALREDLEAKEGMSDGVSAQYQKLITEFRSLNKQYETRVVAYEASLGTYNEEVAQWNNQGGASEVVLERLKATENTLKREQRELEKLADTLRGISAELNRIGARGNALIGDYNSIVEEYNERFSEEYEFTQGDYTGDAINIYQFNSEEELTIVLAHEFGHALALDHVENDASIMYRTMGAQDSDEGITPQDRDEFKQVCSDVGPVVKVLRFIRSIV